MVIKQQWRGNTPSRGRTQEKQAQCGRPSASTERRETTSNISNSLHICHSLLWLMKKLIEFTLKAQNYRMKRSQLVHVVETLTIPHLILRNCQLIHFQVPHFTDVLQEPASQKDTETIIIVLHRAQILRELIVVIWEWMIFSQVILSY